MQKEHQCLNNFQHNWAAEEVIKTALWNKRSYSHQIHKMKNVPDEDENVPSEDESMPAAPEDDEADIESDK